MSSSTSVRVVLALLLALFTLRHAGAAEPVPKGAWLAGVQSQIEAAEYAIGSEGGTYQAPNRAQGFRTSFTEHGIQAVPRVEAEESGWEWGLNWIGYGRGDRSWSVPAATLSVKKNRIDYRRGTLSEWYENGPRGLKQGFVLAVPPEELTTPELPFGRAGDDDLLHVDLALAGSLSPVISEDGQAIDFVTGTGTRVLRYDALLVTDARGRRLPAGMSGFVRGIRISIDDTDALFPITIDPLVGSPTWTYESDQNFAQLGWSVATAGDVNGDGYSDVIVGAPIYDGPVFVDEGAAFLFLGSASGLGPSFAWSARGTFGGQFGYSVATAGDVNGDGYADVIVGEPTAFNPDFSQGKAHAYYGSASGLSPTPAWTVSQPGQSNGAFGATVAPAGDVNGDGYADVVVCSPGFAGGETTEGRALVYHGSATGLATTPEWTAEGDQAGAQLCTSGGTAGDVNGDGYADLIVGAARFDNGQTNEGRAFLYLGSATGLATTAAWTAESNQADALFGHSVGTAGDVNGDGYADVVVAASRFDNGQSNEGAVFVYHGSAAGLSATAAWTGEGGQISAEYGDVVATAGDVDGDGYADLLVGAELFDAGEFDEGRAFLYRGSATGLADAPAWPAESNQVAARFGKSVATAGDVDGDGFSEVLVGAPFFTNGQASEGRAFVYYGSAEPPGLGGEVLGSSAGFARSVATAGDVNGDGYADVIVGDRWDSVSGPSRGKVYVYHGSPSGLSTTASWVREGTRDGGNFGFSVATAGDVDGDGFDDVIVAEPAFLASGAVFVFTGSPFGLASTPAWTIQSAPTNVLAYSVGTAGDVNADGFSDVLVGVPSDSGSSVQLFLGSITGLAATPAATLSSSVPEGFGFSVATAGDVNRDGHSDVIVGAPMEYTGIPVVGGRAFVYLGNPAGISASPVWEQSGGQTSSQFGYSVATAGDVNGDGYADIIVGAPNYTLNEPREGAAFVYLGFSGGVSTNASWVEASRRGNSDYGVSVATAGDVNGDGYADFMVGNPTRPSMVGDRAEALIYRGSAGGPFTEMLRVETEPPTDFGRSLASAGDVNGDGYADVIIGDPDIWQARVWLGNDGGGMAGNPRQRSAGDSRPIAHYGMSDAPDAFRIAMLGRTPFGRGKVRLEWEVKPLGLGFTGASTQGQVMTDTGTLGSELSSIVDGLQPGTPYHWRARLRYDPATVPLAPVSRWMTVPWGGWNETMLRTPALAAGRASGLTLIKAGLGVTAVWAGGGSCLATDTDHAIYEGALGDFTSHVPVTCTTNGNHTWNFTPEPGNRYFLLVPLNVNREGSYGLGANGAERSASTSACKPQLVTVCP